MSKSYQDCWQYFKKGKSNADMAVCNICAKTLSCKASATTGLRRHLEGVHGFKRTENPSTNVIKDNDYQVDKRARHSTEETIVKFLRRSTLPEEVATLAVIDRFTFKQISQSRLIRQALSDKGYKLPKNPSDIMNLMIDFYNDKKQLLINKISDLKLKNVKFSVSIDEWTGTNNRRYMDVQIYYLNKTDNLGMIPIQGSCNAENMYKMVGEKLSSFGINIKPDVMAFISDGAAVMIKFGKLSQVYQQLCYNHGLHLAVIKVLYESKTNSNNVGISDASLEDVVFDSEEEDYYEEISNLKLIPTIEDTINGIRKIVKIFRHSPVRNSILQKYVVEVEKKNLILILDVKTRWNTMEAMLDRFLKIKYPVEKALRDLNSSNLWSEEYIIIAEDILKTLQPIKVTVEFLSREETTLLTAEGALIFLFKQLENIDSGLSLQFQRAIRDELNIRRNKPLISLIKYLQNPESISKSKNNDFCSYSSKSELCEIGKQIFERLFDVPINCNEPHPSVEPLESTESTKEIDSLSLVQQLEQEVSFSLVKSKIKKPLSYGVIENEFKMYESTGERTDNLQCLFDALLSIKPTSTQNERNFSTAENFLTKKRARMCDKTLDAMCFLKGYFKNNKN